VWTELGHAQLESGAVGDAIASYLRRSAPAAPIQPPPEQLAQCFVLHVLEPCWRHDNSV